MYTSKQRRRLTLGGIIGLFGVLHLKQESTINTCEAAEFNKTKLGFCKMERREKNQRENGEEVPWRLRCFCFSEGL